MWLGGSALDLMEICSGCCGVLCGFAFAFILTRLTPCQPDSALMAVTCVCLARHGLAVLWLLLVNEPVAALFFQCHD